MSKEQFDTIVTDNIIKALLKSAEGLTIHKISDLLPNHIPIHALTDYLTNLRDQGMVYLVKGHLWRASGMFPAGAIICADSGNAEESPWNDTRRLCRYYRDCNLLSGSKGMVLWPDRENKIYAQISNRMNWQDLAIGEAVYLPEKAISVTILTGLHREPQCYLCGPIYHTGNRGSLTPVFLNPCTVEWIKDKELLRITLTGYPELNEEWLNRIARNADKRQDLIAYFRGEQLASSEAFSSITVQPDMPQLYSRLRKLLEEDPAMMRGQCVELPCLPSLDSATPFVDIKRGGYYNRLVLVRQDSAVFTQRLQKELNKISVASDSDLDTSGLNVLFPHRSAGSSRQNDDIVLNSDEPCITAQLDTLSPDQRKACHLAMHQAITVVTGPPGTGKSRVVANVMANALLEGKSVLFASRNHQAIDAVVPVLNKLVDNIPVVGRLSLPYGEQNVDPMRECLTAIFNNIISPEAGEDVSGHCAEVRAIRSRLVAFHQALNKRALLHQQVEDRVGRAENLLHELGNLETLVVQQAKLFPAAHKMKTFISVLEEIKLISGSGLWHWFQKWIRKYKRRVLEKRWMELRKLLLTPLQGSPYDNKLSGLSVLSDEINAMVSELRVWLSVCEAAEAVVDASDAKLELERQKTVEDMQTQIHTQEEALNKATKKAVCTIVKATGHQISGAERETMDGLNATLQAGGTEVKIQAQVRKSFPILLKYAPLWAVSNLTAGRYLPLSPGLFDLLIIDEASQCDIPSVIPLLYRAKRVMVVGDQKQLRFVSGITKAANERLRLRNVVDVAEPFDRFDFRICSFFDLANGSSRAGTNCRVLLRDHYRCDSQIADYFNKAFYNDVLYINTDSAKLKKVDRIPFAVRWHQLQADARPGSSGGAISQNQIDAICQELRRLADAQFPGTVGVVTPFRLQADRIRDAAMRQFGNVAPNHWNFKVSPVDGFQGGERDVILFSLVGGPDMPASCAWFYENDPNRFNVAISRARSLLMVFGDRDWTLEWAGNVSSRRHLRLLAQLAHLTDEIPPTQPETGAGRSLCPPIDGEPELIGPVWEPKFAQALWDSGLPVRQQYPSCGRWLDIVLIRNNLKLGIEVDGEAYHRGPDGNRKKEDIMRDLVLIANGWRIKRFWVYELREDWDRCVNEIQSLWQANA